MIKISPLLFLIGLFSYDNYQENIAIVNYVSYQETPIQASIKRGKEVYLDMCVTCHLPSGEGVENVFPPLAKADFLIQNRAASIQAIKYGIEGKITVNGVVYNGNMASMGLENDEVADVMNYITNAWGNKNDTIITEEEVANTAKPKQ